MMPMRSPSIAGCAASQFRPYARSVTLSSRLSLILAVVVFVHLLSRSHPNTRVRFRFVAAAVVLVFLALIPLSYSRDAGYYSNDNKIFFKFV